MGKPLEAAEGVFALAFPCAFVFDLPRTVALAVIVLEVAVCCVGRVRAPEAVVRVGVERGVVVVKVGAGIVVHVVVGVAV